MATSPRYGVDYSTGRPGATALKTAGYSFACRYLAGKAAGKALTQAEADGLRAAGVDLVSNWEVAAQAALNGHAQGVADAKAAASAHLAAGGPAGRPIYFSADWDATEAQQAAINAYFDGVASVIGLARTGAYGGYYVIKRLFDAGKIRWGWQTYAWSGGQWDSRAQLRQVQNGITVAGADCDRNQAMVPDFGQWGYEESNVGFFDDPNAYAMAERIDALAAGSDTSRGGPVKGEPIWLVTTVKDLAAAVASIQGTLALPQQLDLTTAQVQDLSTSVSAVVAQQVTAALAAKLDALSQQVAAIKAALDAAGKAL